MSVYGIPSVNNDDTLSVRKIDADFLLDQHNGQTMLFPGDLVGT